MNILGSPAGPSKAITLAAAAAAEIIAAGRREYWADQTLSPDASAAWNSIALAPVQTDASDASILVAAFDDTAEEGRGLDIDIPAGATNMTIYFDSRAATAPGTTKTVIPKIYTKKVRAATPAAVSAWSAATTMTSLNIPITNAYYQKDSQTIALASFATTLVAGDSYKILFTRAQGTLVGDWLLRQIRVEFS